MSTDPLQCGESLRSRLRGLDGRSYRAYREIRGGYAFDGCAVHVDHVQGDPFAAPSLIRVRVPSSLTGFPASLFDTPTRRLAFEDFLARAVRDAIGPRPQRAGSGGSGAISIDAGGQQVLQRTAVVVTTDWVEARLQVGMPAAGRRILGREAERMLCDRVPQLARTGLTEASIEAAREFVDCVDDQEAIRARLPELGLVAFVADGSVLARESGASDRPLHGAVPFESPPTLRVEIPLPHGSSRTGLGVRRGVTLIVGGGYHGKSTLLDAIAHGVYPHIPRDGREGVVSDRSLVKVRAEDGRRVEQVDIDAFISGLPAGRSTRQFESDDASGSTSQAANIVESLEVGASGLLLDEDTCATNFMMRDARMQALIHREDEPITPFVERVRELYEHLGVSTVLVMGGSGEYFDAADTVVAMREFVPRDVTADARRIAAEFAPAPRSGLPSRPPLRQPTARVPLTPPVPQKPGKVAARGLDRISWGRESIDLRAIEQLVDESQTRAIARAIALCARSYIDGTRSLGEVLDELDRTLDERGCDALGALYRRAPDAHPGNFARPRRFEVAAAINRLRSLKMRRD